MIQSVAVDPDPHTAVLGLQDVSRVVAREPLTLAEYGELAISQLAYSRIEQADPETALPILKQRMGATVAGQAPGGAVEFKMVPIEPADSVPIECNPQSTIVIHPQGLDRLPRKRWRTDDTPLTNLCNPVVHGPHPNRSSGYGGQSRDGISG